MTDFVSYVIDGLPFGCVYALVAIGLVLTYKTAGVFNLALAVQSFLSAAVYYDLKARHDWPIVPALFVAVFVVGPVVGFILDRFLFRYLRSAPPVARLVCSLGLLVAGPEIVILWFGRTGSVNPPAITTNPDRQYHFLDYVVSQRELAIIVTTLLAVGGLMLLFRYSAIGLQMRAVVESPRMTELSGINADRVGSFAWMLSSVFAGLAGVLVAPLYVNVASQNFLFLLIAAVAAAAFGRLSSLPLTLLGGLLLGAAQGLLAAYLPSGSVLANGLRPGLPFAALFLLLLFWPGLRQRRETVDPLSGVDPPPPAPVATERSRALTIATRVFALVAIGVGSFFVFFQLDSYWLLIVTQGVVYATIFLSITVITGMGGQLSLCQATFAGVGGFTTAQLVDRYSDMPVLLTIVIGALLAAVVGGLLAIPALRLGGIYMSLATLAFAFMFNAVLVPLDWVSGGFVPLRVPRPVVGPVDFASDKAFLMLCIVVLAAVSVLVIFVRKGTTGRYLAALRASEPAAASIGINPARARVTALALSAGIAGLGGGMLVTLHGRANTVFFEPLFGLFFVVIVVTLGARSVQGAITAGLAFMLFPEFLDAVGLSASYQFIFFGLGALTFARHPEGIIEFQTRKSLTFIQGLLDRRKGPPATSAPGSPSPPGGDGAAGTRQEEPVR